MNRQKAAMSFMSVLRNQLKASLKLALGLWVFHLNEPFSGRQWMLSLQLLAA
jgi:hypothetical protein